MPPFSSFAATGWVRDAYALADARVATLRTALTAPSEARRDASFREHLDMVAQLERRDMAAFRATLSEHIARTRRVATLELQKFKRKPDESAAQTA